MVRVARWPRALFSTRRVTRGCTKRQGEESKASTAAEAWRVERRASITPSHARGCCQSQPPAGQVGQPTRSWSRVGARSDAFFGRRVTKRPARDQRIRKHEVWNRDPHAWLIRFLFDPTDTSPNPQQTHMAIPGFPRGPAFRVVHSVYTHAQLLLFRDRYLCLQPLQRCLSHTPMCVTTPQCVRSASGWMVRGKQYWSLREHGQASSCTQRYGHKLYKL